MTKLICKYFDGWFLQDIRPIDVQKYLIYLRTEYTGKSGKPLTAKNTFTSIQHIASDFRLRRTAGAHFEKSDAQSGHAEKRKSGRWTHSRKRRLSVSFNVCMTVRWIFSVCCTC